MLKISLISILLTSSVFASQEVNIYSKRHYDTDKQLFKLFTEETGIKVNVVKAKAKELMKRLESEGKHTKADLLITVDVGNLVLAKQKNLLQAVKSDKLDKAIPAHLRQKDGYWYGLTKRARVVVYNKNKVKKEELSTYDDLTNEKWKKRILIRKSNNIYNQSLLASFIANDGIDSATTWAKGIVSNVARTPKGNDRDQMKAIAAGIGDIAVVNTYYVGKLLNSKKSNEVEVGKLMAVFFPNQGKNERGAHINISGAGVTKYAKNKENAIKFLEFLSSVKAQEIFAKTNYEYPVNPKAKASKLLQSWGTFKEDKTPLELFGINNANAVKVFNNVGWK